jgi:MFS-type transporter involved in bile tolerance (Atg22 family)
MKPSAAHKWLLASVMAVVWAIATSVLWGFLALAFGRSKSDMRLIAVLIIGAVVGAFLVAHAYSEGWKSGSRASLSSRKDSNA